jgi:Vacuolar import and degradation protein
MPTQHANTMRAAHPTASPTSALIYSYPLTPPSDIQEVCEAAESDLPCQEPGEDHGETAVNDNTAAGMSFMQSESMYRETADVTTTESQAFAEKEKAMLHDLYVATATQEQGDQPRADLPPTVQSDTRRQPQSSNPISTQANQPACDHDERDDVQSLEAKPTDKTSVQQEPRPASSRTSQPQASRVSPDKAASFPEYSATNYTSDSDYGTKPWDFSHVPLVAQYPSSLLRPGSRFEGTQQSEHQIYSVTVTIYTVDVPQCTLSGYLKIDCLTPDHPTLTTFFTGEIIGGPNQKYSFQTKHAGWGATDKTDLVHWARFPAWRPLSRDAKRDINFQYPMPGTGLLGNDNWWQQEHIFMRWKEWFLVPDHRVRSIQGASFEGFYYICFNQIEGRISGIYFHARSEK